MSGRLFVCWFCWHLLPIQRASVAWCSNHKQQELDVSEELTSTTKRRGRGLNHRLQDPWASTLPLSYAAIHCEADACLYEEVPENLSMIVSSYHFWFYPPVFTVLNVLLITYGPVYYWGHIAVSLSVLALTSLLQPLMICTHGLCISLAQPASEILHSIHSKHTNQLLLVK